jgi:hypothetical protein
VGIDEASLFVAAFEAASHLIGDRIIQVALSAMNLVQTVCATKKPQLSLKGELLSYYETIVGALLERLGEFINR